MPGIGGSGGGRGANAIKAGEAYIEATVDDKNAKGKLQDFAARLKRVGGFVRNIGLGTAALGAAILAPLIPAVDTLQELGKLSDTAGAFNLTAEAASRLFGIFAAAGSDLRDATEGLATFNARIDDAIAGKGAEAQELFMKLGMGAEEFVRLPTDKRVYKLLEAIRKLPPEVNKVFLLSKAFGEDTAKNLIPLLNMTEKEIQELGDAFQMSAKDLEDARNASREYTKATAAIKGIWAQIVIAIAPPMTELLKLMTPLIKGVVEFVKVNKELVIGAVVVGASLLTVGTSLAALGFGISGIVAGATAIGAIVTALAAVAGPVAAVGVAIAAIAGLITFATTALIAFSDKQRTIGAEWGAMWSAMRETFSKAWGGITAALGKGDLQLAWKIAVAAMAVTWQEFVVFVQTQWNKVKTFFVEAFHEAIMIITLMFNDMWGYFQRFSISAIGNIVEAFYGVTDALGLTSDKMKDVAKLHDEMRAKVRANTKAEEKEIFKRADAEAEARKKAREDALAEERKKLSGYKAIFAQLVAMATATPAAPPMSPSSPGRMRPQFGEAVRGTFGSADYKGYFGVGPATDYAKETAKASQEAVKQLVIMNKKLDKLEGPQFK